MEQEQLIQAYFKGQLSEETLKEFDRLYKEDSAFAKAITAYKTVHKSIQEHERVVLKKQLQVLETKQEDKKAISLKKWFVAASIVFIVGLISVQFFTTQSSSQELYAQYFEPYPNALHPIIRGVDISSNPMLSTFFSYEQGNYTKATQGFKAMLTSKEDTDIRFYYAMSLLNEGKLTIAHQELEYLKNSDTKFIAQVYWYSSLILIKKGEKDAAIQQLNSLKELLSDYKKEERQLLLKQLQ